MESLQNKGIVMAKDISDTNFSEIVNLIQNSRQKVYAQVNSTTIELYWNVGQYISTKLSKIIGVKVSLKS